MTTDWETIHAAGSGWWWQC